MVAKCYWKAEGERRCFFSYNLFFSCPESESLGFSALLVRGDINPPACSAPPTTKDKTEVEDTHSSC